MPRKSAFDVKRLSGILHQQLGVVSRAQVFACGMSRKALHLRIAPSGPWQRLLPGVYAGVTGAIEKDRQRPPLPIKALPLAA